LETLVESDASDFAAAGVLSQRFPEPDGSLVLHPVAYYSRKLTPAECNYGIGDKKLLAIVVAFEEWRPHLIGTKDPILVLTDHNNLQGFLTKKLLNCRQARWALELSEYNLKIVYRPGPKHAKADALTRRSGDLPKQGDGRSRPVDAVLKPENFDSASFGPAFGHAFGSIDAILASVNGDPNLQAPGKATTGNLAATINLAATDILAAAGKLASIATKVPTHVSSFSCFELNSTSRAFHSDIRNALLHDDLGKEIIHALRSKVNHHPQVALSECEYQDGLLLVNGLLYVPTDEELHANILRHYHDHPAAGHPGRAATYELVSRDYWWPKLRHTIARYLRNCDTCARIKPARHAPYGFLKPLPIPQRGWESVSMDFIVGLPESSGFDAILVVVDRLTKMAHFLPTTGTVDSEGTAALFRDGVFRLHGLPSDLVSDRGATFTSEFFRSLCRLTGIAQNLSTAFHPQTDGQTEHVNSVLEQYLRGYCNYQQDNWAELLSMAEFSYNNKVSATTGISPFFANYHYHPRYEIRANSELPTPTALIDYSDRLTSLEKYLLS
jgi:hypothetical protein